MQIDYDVRANVMIEALPYLQKYNNKVVVIKYGGNAMTNDDLKQAVMRDIVMLTTVGIKVVLVHGGGPEINDMLNKVGKKSQFINGLRYTDDETIDIVQMYWQEKSIKILFQCLKVTAEMQSVCAELTEALLKPNSSIPIWDMSVKLQLFIPK